MALLVMTALYIDKSFLGKGMIKYIYSRYPSMALGLTAICGGILVFWFKDAHYKRVRTVDQGHIILENNIFWIMIFISFVLFSFGTIKIINEIIIMVEYIRSAQQVDSAEASTIAVPPSDPPGSPR